MPRAKVKPKTFATVRAIAKHYGCSAVAVYKWFDEPVPCPGGKKGPWVCAEIDEWGQSRSRGKVGRAHDPFYEKIARRRDLARVLKDETAARREAVKLHQADKRYVAAAEVNQFVATFLAELRRQAQASPAEMAVAYPMEIREAIKTDLTNRIGILLNQAGDFVQKFNDSKSVADVTEILEEEEQG